MKNLFRNLSISIFIITVTTVCSFGQLRLAVSKTSPSYEEWIHVVDPDVVIVNMYGMSVDSALFVLSTCHGLLLTGGEDVNPVYYGKGNELSKCEEIDKYRDSLELSLISRALLVRMPVFGICRGEQILNVALGGSLLTDIPTDAGTAVVHRCPPGSKDCLHSVKIDKQSELYQLTKVENGLVNSYHHQAVDMVAPGMKISALSDNGVAEAIERELPLGKSFIMGVQWHPEALDKNPGLSRPLAVNFVEQVAKYKQDRRNCCGAY
ncbi:MAG: gamma-glutamyl-gamma-aminobutyrate hydrolase family protein [Bacteroidales bacterium]|nr:gamma-glutamyl-gamma-aminobutyrate hydrolase family protein [Bacteroidales bacterium]